MSNVNICNILRTAEQVWVLQRNASRKFPSTNLIFYDRQSRNTIHWNFLLWNWVFFPSRCFLSIEMKTWAWEAVKFDMDYAEAVTAEFYESKVMQVRSILKKNLAWTMMFRKSQIILKQIQMRIINKWYDLIYGRDYAIKQDIVIHLNIPALTHFVLLWIIWTLHIEIWKIRSRLNLRLMLNYFTINHAYTNTVP